MKKFMSLVVVAFVSVALVGCGGKTDSKKSSSKSGSASTQTVTVNVLV